MTSLVRGTVAAALALIVAAGCSTDRPTSTGTTSGTAQGTAPGTSPGTPPTVADDLTLVGDLTPAGDCRDLLASYVRRGEQLVGPWGWEPPVVAIAALQDGGAAARSSAPSTTRAESGATGTNVQETGVDEPDVAKTDGERLVRVADDVLEVHDVTGERPRLLGELALDSVRKAELLLDGDRVVVLGRDRLSRGQRVLVVDLGDPAEPAVVSDRAWSGRLLEARMHTDGESVVRLVVGSRLPRLGFTHPGRGRTLREARRINQRLVRESRIDDWLPRSDGEPAVDCADVLVPDDADAALGTTSVAAFTPAEPDRASVTAVATDAGTAYVASDRLYLAEAPSLSGWGWPVPVRRGARVAVAGRGDGATSIHAFALDGLETSPAAAGEIEGDVADRWAMDSVDGVLRVAVGPTHRTDDANSVVTLREDDYELVEAGRVDGLGRREQIKSVRWFDDLAVVVTFRQVDPFYTVDLSDPDDPTLLGELKIPGFSEYLHPLGPRRMIGLGQATDRRGVGQGAQAALYAVRDLTDPRRLDVATFPRRSQAGAAVDPRQFTWLPEQRTALAVVSRGWVGRTGWLAVLRVRDGGLESELVPVEDGTEVARVRTLPLPSGEVALVTDAEVSFLDLD